MTDYSEFVPNVHFEQIPIKNLVSNQGYQRALSKAHIAKAAANFDIYQINPVKVSRRDGINYVFDGQHTAEVVALVSGSRETPVWCMIYDDLCYQHEADIFAEQQKYTKPLNPYEIFVGHLEAGNSDQLIIKRLVESYGLTIGKTNKDPRTLCAVSALESIYTKYGYHVLDRVLRLCIGTWEGENNSMSGNMLNAVARVVVTYGDELNDQLFVEKLGAIPVKSVIRTAKERGSGSLSLAECLVIEYNGKKRNPHYKLQIKRLYEKRAYYTANTTLDHQDNIENNEPISL